MKLIHDELQFEVEDLQDLDNTFAVIIHTGLVAFKARIEERGDILIPSKIWSRYCTHPAHMTTAEEFCATKEWLGILDAMIAGFAPNNDLVEGVEGRKLFAEYFTNLWS